MLHSRTHAPTKYFKNTYSKVKPYALHRDPRKMPK